VKIILFEDESVHDLAPITTGRPAYAVTCASYRLLDIVRELGHPIYGAVRPHLRSIQTLDYQLLDFSADNFTNDDVLVVNARLVPSRDNLHLLQQVLAAPVSAAVLHPSGIAIARFQSFPLTIADSAEHFHRKVATLAANVTIRSEVPAMFVWPHDVVEHNMELMNSSLNARLEAGGYKEVQDGVFLAAGAEIGQYAAIDTTEGPILLDRDVKVGPFCYLSGPVYAGPRTRVIEHAALKDGVSLGHTVKIGGEVEASVIEPFSNKQHHGFLGHSYLGSWINLGAGTCNSDLKNTYGTINMQYGSKRATTSMQFMGCIMGDYTKTAINTGIFTGKVVGVCSMLYGFVTSNVPSFVNYARLFGQTAELPPEVMIATQQRMFARRKVTQRPCDQQLIHDMHALTESEREGQLGSL